jgi:hypothetical protein
MKALALALAAGAAILPAQAHAEVIGASPTGFAVGGSAVATGHTPEEAWYLLIEPAAWWSGAHTWSGDAANLRLDPRAGGCFCEDLAQGGSAQHMRVIYAAPGEMLRMDGALGPLQGEGVTGTLTVALAAAPGGTEISWTYVVGGHARFALSDMAEPVDGVIGEQLHRMVSQLINPAPR